jgi:hypothetical protein
LSRITTDGSSFRVIGKAIAVGSITTIVGTEAESATGVATVAEPEA